MHPSEDLASVVNRTALIENLLDQVIEGFLCPRVEVLNFFWDVVLNPSILSLADKVKIALAVSYRLNSKLDKEALQDVMKYRNAFAHHPTNSHPVLYVGATPEKDESHYTLHIMAGSGKIQTKRRKDALDAFDFAFKSAKESLLTLLVHIRSTDKAVDGS